MGKLSSGKAKAAPQVAAASATVPTVKTFTFEEVQAMMAQLQAAPAAKKRGRKAKYSGPFADNFVNREGSTPRHTEIYFDLNGVSTRPEQVICDELSELGFRYHVADDKPARWWGFTKMLQGTKFEDK